MFTAYIVVLQFMFRCLENGDSDEYNKHELQIKKLTAPET